jgi:hypothetical protein
MIACRGAAFPFLLVILAPVMIAGCDSAGSKRASQAQRLSGEWELCVDAGSGSCDALENVTLHVSDGEGEKDYTLTRTQGGNEISGQGEVDVIQPDVLRMTGEYFSGDLIWTLNFDKPSEISGSARLSLVQWRDEGVREFLNFLGVTGWTGGRIRMDLRLSS